MSLSLSTAVRNNRLQAISDAIDGGTGAGTLKLYDGSQPSPGAAVTGQNLIATLTFADPSAASITGGVLTFANIDSVQADADGTVTWARVEDSAGTFVLDGNIGGIGSGAFIEIDNAVLYTGGLVKVTVGKITEPQ